MSKTYEQIVAELNAKIPRDVISQREGGGRKLSYLEGWYVIDRLNEVLGIGNWEYDSSVYLIHAGQVDGRSGPVHSVHYKARVMLTAQIGDKRVNFVDYGYGDGTDKVNPGKAHELAIKESVTDGIKRCAKNLGMSLGLALYDKTQENVDDGTEDTREAPKSKLAAVPRSVGAAAAKAPEQVQRDEQSPVSNGNGQEAPASREALNSAISKHGQVIVARKIKSLTDLKMEMKAKYGTDKKEDLTDEQAKELYGTLKSLISA